jgi:hypothetical protein
MRAKCKLSLCLVPPLAHKASKCNQQTPPPPTPMSWRGIRLMSITTSQICLPLCFTSQLQIKPLLATSDLPLTTNHSLPPSPVSSRHSTWTRYSQPHPPMSPWGYAPLLYPASLADRQTYFLDYGLPSCSVLYYLCSLPPPSADLSSALAQPWPPGTPSLCLALEEAQHISWPVLSLPSALHTSHSHASSRWLRLWVSEPQSDPQTSTTLI